jgi:hypothetical protein
VSPISWNSWLDWRWPTLATLRRANGRLGAKVEIASIKPWSSCDWSSSRYEEIDRKARPSRIAQSSTSV